MSGLQSKLSTSKRISMRQVTESKTRSTIDEYMQKLNEDSLKVKFTVKRNCKKYTLVQITQCLSLFE